MKSHFRLVLLMGLFALPCSCTEPSTSKTLQVQASSDKNWKEAQKYLTDSGFGRKVLEESLVNHKNPYSAIRLENYTDDKWGALPIWNPRVRPVRPSDLGKHPPKPDDSWKRLNLEEFDWNEETVVKFGQDVFFNYPVALRQYMIEPLRSKESPNIYGLWQTKDRVGGLMWIEVPGGVFPATTCSTCHAGKDKTGKLHAGAPNHRIDNGRIRQHFAGANSEYGRWGPGRADVNNDGVFNPSVIADLRPLRFQPFLQRAALIKNSIPALAVRFETGIITGGTRRHFRPPRKAMVALAHYLWQLADSLPEPPSGKGKQIFKRECASCHSGPGLNGAPVPMAKVGTDRSVVRAKSRFTGSMQLPSLRGLGNRRLFFSSGSVRSLEDLLDPDRTPPGHTFGTKLSDEEKQLLLHHLKAL